MRFVAIALLTGAALASSQDGAVHVGGSTTLLPIVATCASDFMEAYETWDKADTSLPKKQTLIYVTGGGSGFGVKSTINDTFQIGLVSRDLKKEEKEKLGEHEQFLVGKDCVAIAVHKDNPLVGVKKNFTKDDLARIFSGEVKTYRQIDASLPDKEIVLLVRDSGAGSAEIMQKSVMGERKVSSGALQMPSQGALLKKLDSNPLAFAYISSGLVQQNDNLRTFAFEGVEPTHEKVIKGEYTLARPLLLIVKGRPAGAVKRFIDYLLNEGQKVVKAQGYIAVKDAKE
jgi:phosphate transport system substrate-binding protein